MGFFFLKGELVHLPFLSSSTYFDDITISELMILTSNIIIMGSLLFCMDFSKFILNFFKKDVSF